jgi:hypothetical protein
MKIRDVQTRMLELAGELEDPNGEMELAEIAKELRVLVVELFRRKAVRKAPIKARAIDPQLKAQLREVARLHPEMPYREIGRMFGVDGGRVSEALAGKRK